MTSVPPTPSARRTRPITVVLRVVPGAAIDGRLAGRVEVVDTGESVPVRNADELMELLTRLARDADASG